MSEAKCICGHDHLWPDAVLGQQQFDDCCEEECECDTFRPVLPWPDAEGYWAMRRGFCSEDWQPVFAFLSEGRFVIAKIGSEQLIEQGSEDAECADWLSQFTRLLEANPFEK